MFDSMRTYQSKTLKSGVREPGQNQSNPIEIAICINSQRHGNQGFELFAKAKRWSSGPKSIRNLIAILLVVSKLWRASRMITQATSVEKTDSSHDFPALSIEPYMPRFGDTRLLPSRVGLRQFPAIIGDQAGFSGPHSWTPHDRFLLEVWGNQRKHVSFHWKGSGASFLMFSESFAWLIIPKHQDSCFP